MSIFQANTPSGKTLRDWWADLENNKGDRAALKRCGRPVEIAFIGAFHKLRFNLQSEAFSPERLLLVAGLVPQVRLGDPSTDQGRGDDLAVQMAKPSGKGREAAVHELRFRRLLQCQHSHELLIDLRRIIRLLDNRVDIYSLANTAYGWNDRTRKRMAFAYYDQLSKNM